MDGERDIKRQLSWKKTSRTKEKADHFGEEPSSLSEDAYIKSSGLNTVYIYV